MQAEGELRSNLDESDRVRDLQDKVADLKAEVSRCRLNYLSLLTGTLIATFVPNTKMPFSHVNTNKLTSIA